MAVRTSTENSEQAGNFGVRSGIREFGETGNEVQVSGEGKIWRSADSRQKRNRGGVNSGGEREGLGSQFRASSGHSRGRSDGVRGQGHMEGRGSTGIGRGIGDTGEDVVGGKSGEWGGTWSGGEKREVRWRGDEECARAGTGVGEGADAARGGGGRSGDGEIVGVRGASGEDVHGECGGAIDGGSWRGTG